LSALWLNKVKIALIEEEYETLSSLCQEMPSFEDIQQMHEANALIQEAILSLKNEQQKTQETMQKLKKNAHFLSTEKKKSRLCTLT